MNFSCILSNLFTINLLLVSSINLNQLNCFKDLSISYRLTQLLKLVCIQMISHCKYKKDMFHLVAETKATRSRELVYTPQWLYFKKSMKTPCNFLNEKIFQSNYFGHCDDHLNWNFCLLYFNFKICNNLINK